MRRFVHYLNYVLLVFNTAAFIATYTLHLFTPAAIFFLAAGCAFIALVYEGE